MRANVPASTLGGGPPPRRPGWFRRLAARTSAFTGRPAAFFGAVGLILVWAAAWPFFHYSNAWQLVINTGGTIATVPMVFLIQATQNRDAAAIQLKLDEILRALETARNEIIDVEERSDEEISALKAELARAGAEVSGRAAS